MMKKEFEKRLISSLILIPLAFFFIIKGSLFFIFFLSIIFLISSYEWLKMNKKIIEVKFLGILFLFFSIYFAYLLRKEEGIYLFLFVILVSILTDLGGYIFGKIFKGPKLTKISPKKTYSGMFGSFILSIIGGIFYIKTFTNMKFLTNNIIQTIIIILAISLISQIGDLIISYFKRKANIKNTGKILPGHGGLLDRIDGIIFVVPFSYLILNI